jgi:L-glyceraldehyde 3-phosphate reductase
MLTPKYVDGIPSGSRAARPEGFLQEAQVLAQQATIRNLNDIARSHAMPLHHLALRWALQQQGVCSLIIGARTCEQLLDNLQVLETPALSDQVLDEINRIAPARRGELRE